MMISTQYLYKKEIYIRKKKEPSTLSTTSSLKKNSYEELASSDSQNQERLIYDETPIKKHSCPKTDQSIAPPPLPPSTEKLADRERDPLPPSLSSGPRIGRLKAKSRTNAGKNGVWPILKTGMEGDVVGRGEFFRREIYARDPEHTYVYRWCLHFLFESPHPSLSSPLPSTDLVPLLGWRRNEKRAWPEA